MCDYSLMHLASRPAKVGDKLTCGTISRAESPSTPSFTRGLFDESDPHTAVCLIPGTEVAFAQEPVKFLGLFTVPRRAKTATFRQINRDTACVHHDALEFAAGDVKLVHDLAPGQKMTVLQLPAAPTNEREAAEQKRLEVIA